MVRESKWWWWIGRLYGTQKKKKFKNSAPKSVVTHKKIRAGYFKKPQAPIRHRRSTLRDIAGIHLIAIQLRRNVIKSSETGRSSISVGSNYPLSPFQSSSTYCHTCTKSNSQQPKLCQGSLIMTYSNGE
jgi:hypothetical protein